VGLGAWGVEGGSGDLKVVGAAGAVKRHDVSLLSLLTSGIFVRRSRHCLVQAGCGSQLLYNRDNSTVIECSTRER
jgi:hypothetical protein